MAFAASFVILLSGCLVTTGQRIFDPPAIEILEPNFTPSPVVPDILAVDISAGEELHLRCNGSQPIIWEIAPQESGHKPNISGDCQPIDRDDLVGDVNVDRRPEIVYPELRCTSDLIISNMTYRQTGLFTCRYNETRQLNDGKGSNFASVYIFANDEEHLLIDGWQKILVVNGNDLVPVQIPCRPADSRTLVSLHLANGDKSELIPGDMKGLTYDPSKGFALFVPKYSEQYSQFTCKAHLGPRSDDILVQVIWSSQSTSKPIQLIDASRADPVFLNNSYSLGCSFLSHVEDSFTMQFYFPNGRSTTAQVREEPEEFEVIDGSTFRRTIKTLVLTSISAKDQGWYYCDVTDAKGRSYYGEHFMTVYHAVTRPYLTFLSVRGSPASLIKDAGQALTYRVVVNSYPPLDEAQLAELTWERNRKPLVVDESRVSFERTETGDFLLTIANLTGEDSGFYQLMSAKPRAQLSFVLHVESAPLVDFHRITTTTSMDGHSRGDEYEFTCSVVAFPKPDVRIQWRPLHPVLALSETTTLLPKLNDTMTNSNHTANGTTTTTITEEPEMEEKWEDIGIVNIRQLADLRSKDRGDEIGNMNREQITIGVVEEESRVMASLSLTAIQSGVYRCMAANEVGNGSQSLDFLVTERQGQRSSRARSKILTADTPGANTEGSGGGAIIPSLWATWLLLGTFVITLIK